MPPHLRDERLARLAVADRLERDSRRGLFALFSILSSRPVSRGPSSNNAVRKDHATGRMMRYGIAVDRLTPRLSPQEREVLRTTGEVPGWFHDAVVATARTIDF